MKSITWKVALNEDSTQIATAEQVQGLPQDKIESHLLMIGILENLKQKHLDKLATLYEKTVKGGEGDEEE